MSKLDIFKKYNNEINNDNVFQFIKYQIIMEEDQKYLIFVIRNNYSEVLKEVEFIVEEYFDNNKLKKAVFNLDNLQVPENKSYVPALKIPLNDKTTDVVLIPEKITYTKSVFEKGFLNENLEEENDQKTTVIKITKPKRLVMPIILLLLTIYIFFFTLINAKIYNEDTNLDRHDIFEYVKFSDGIAITRYRGISPKVTIPEEYDGHKVLGINDSAFGNSEITSLVIDADNIFIETNAFYGASSLKTIVGKNINYISNSAFKYNNNLKSVKFESVNKIYDFAFQGTNNLNVFEIGDIENTEFSYQSMVGSNTDIFKYIDNHLIINETLVAIQGHRELLVTDDSEFDKISKNLSGASTVNFLRINKTNFELNKETIAIFSNLITLDIDINIKLEIDLFYLLSPTTKVLIIPSIDNYFLTYFDTINDYHFESVHVKFGDAELYFYDTEEYIGNILEVF